MQNKSARDSASRDSKSSREPKRKSSKASRLKDERKGLQTVNFDNEIVDIGEETIDYHTISCVDDWTRNMQCHQIYVKSGSLLTYIQENNDEGIALPKFTNDFEKRRAYRMAYAVKRSFGVLKAVLRDSLFSERFHELVRQYEPIILVMLLDFYEHKLSTCYFRKKCDLHSEHFQQYIDDIAAAFVKSKIKLSAAFARQRIEYCAPSLEEILPLEEKEQRKKASKQPLYFRINTLMTSKSDILEKLEESKFRLYTKMTENEEDFSKFYCIDEHFEELLVFPKHVQDELQCMDVFIKNYLIPQSKPKYVVGELAKHCLNDMSGPRTTSMSLTELLHGTKLESRTPENDCILLTHPEIGSLSSHICSYLENNQKLIICGCSGEKYEQLQTTLKNIGASHYTLISEAFCDMLPSNEFLKQIKVAICNPPCSKSGVANTMDFLLYESSSFGLPLSKEAITEKLPGLILDQVSTLNHTLKLPALQSVIYCTFSTKKLENDNVVDQFLMKDNDILEKCPVTAGVESVCNLLPHVMKADTPYLSLPASDKMDGFFIALLKRKKAALPRKVDRVIKQKSQIIIQKEKKVRRNGKKKDSVRDFKYNSVRHTIAKSEPVKKNISKKYFPRINTKPAATKAVSTPTPSMAVIKRPKKRLVHGVELAHSAVQRTDIPSTAVNDAVAKIVESPTRRSTATSERDFRF